MEARAERSMRVNWYGCGVGLSLSRGLASGGPATGGRSMRHDRRCFGRMEQEDQRLRKHYGYWMDIVRSLELESFILTKLTKPSVSIILVGPQVSLPQWWVPANKGQFSFFCA